MRKERQHDYEYIKKYFEINGCELIEEEYINNETQMMYIAQCGCINSATFSNFSQGKSRECRSCVQSGKKHHNYNPNLSDEERLVGRNYPEYRQWIKDVYVRDLYTCQCCNKKGTTLNAHHKDGYSWCVDRRLDINNGVTLCEKCHKEFHSLYGNKNNTEKQFIEFINKLEH